MTLYEIMWFLLNEINLFLTQIVRILRFYSYK